MAVSSDTASVDDTLGDTFVVESMNLLQSDLVFKKGRTGALRVRSLQPDIGCRAQHRRMGKGKMSDHV